MSAWLVIEDTKSGTVNLYNLDNVSAIQVDTELGEDVLKIWTVDDPNIPWEENIDGLEEFETLINLLPGAEILGWIYIKDGKVRGWKGKLKLLEKVEEERGEPESEQVQETGCWDEDAKKFRQPCP